MSVPNFQKYLDLVPPGSDILMLSTFQHASVTKWLTLIPESKWMELHPPYTWTLKQVLHHLTDAERVFSFRLFWMVRGADAPQPYFDEQAFLQKANPNAMPAKKLIQEFDVVRQSTLALLHSLKQSDWEEVGQIGDYQISAADQARILVGHVVHHWNILRSRFNT